jgi:flagellar basal body rod protein FlgG
MNSFEIAAIAFQRDQQQLAAVGQNIANANSVGYRRQIPMPAEFGVHWLQASGHRPSADADASGLTLRVAMDTSAGKLTLTERALDVSLAAGDYLQVAREDGSAALSRAGSLRLDAERRLTTSQGHRVLDVKGGHIALPAQAQRVEVNAAGQVMADGQLVGRLGLVRLHAQAELTSRGDGLLEQVSGPSPQGIEDPQVRVGALESSNVSASQEMVHLMATTRHAEAMARIVQGSDELLEKAIRKFGDLS